MKLDKTKTEQMINRGLDFARDSDVGYLMMDFDIILAITMADYNENVSIEDAEVFFNKVKKRREINRLRGLN